MAVIWQVVAMFVWGSVLNTDTYIQYIYTVNNLLSAYKPMSSLW